MRETEKRKLAVRWPWKYWFHARSYWEIKNKLSLPDKPVELSLCEATVVLVVLSSYAFDSSYCFLASSLSSTVLPPACWLSTFLLPDILHKNTKQFPHISVSVRQENICKVMLHKSRSSPLPTLDIVTRFTYKESVRGVFPFIYQILICMCDRKC